MFKLCIFAIVLAVALAAPAPAEEAKTAKRSIGYSVPIVSAPTYAYSAPLSYSNYVAPSPVLPYYGGYHPYGAHYPLAYSSPFYY